MRLVCRLLRHRLIKIHPLELETREGGYVMPTKIGSLRISRECE
jgi:hypothetical protein